MILLFSVLTQKLAGKNEPEMTYLVSSGIINLNTINQLWLSGRGGARWVTWCWRPQLTSRGVGHVVSGARSSAGPIAVPISVRLPEMIHLRNWDIKSA